jgi:carboxypeptidase family protein
MRLSQTIVIVCLAMGALVHAQGQNSARRDGRLLVTVADPSGAVIPNAKVSVVGLDEAMKAATIAPVQTSSQGIATLSGLVPGRYSIVAEFPGFELGLLRDVRVRPGDNRHIVVLPLQRVLDTVNVAQDNQIAAADRNSTFGTTLTREQVASLSDDPAEMQQQLQDMAGGNAIIRIDSFEGGQLPPKAQIKSIHITRDAFAAENHNIEGIIVDIITQPGVGTMHGMTQLRYRNGTLSGRSPFTTTKGPEEVQNYQLAVGGSLLKNRSSYSITMSGQHSFGTPNLNVALPGGTNNSQVLPIKTPVDTVLVSGLVDYAVTKDQTLRMGFTHLHDTYRNLGVGGFNSIDRAYTYDSHFDTFRLQEAGPLGRRFFTNTRVMLTSNGSTSHSALEAPTIQVLDSFTNGGAQQAGERRSIGASLASDLDYVRGKHSIRTGVQLDGLRVRSNETQNYLGTYTFGGLDAFNAGTPRSYIRRIGDPNIAYWSLQAGAYLQDDIRVRKGLTLSPGLRYEAQTHLAGKSNFGPRFGATYAPWKSGKTSFRGSYGVFYQWLFPNTYEQTVRVDGFHQQEINIVNPTFPDPGNVGTILPTSRYTLSGNLQMVRLPRLSVGIDETLTPRVRFSSTYTYVRSNDLQRGRNLNAPVNGVRPNPAFANIIEVDTDARQRQHQLNNNVTVSLSSPSAAVNRPRWNLRRTQFQLLYILARVRNNSEGAFIPPSTGNIADDWGPAQNDVRRRMNFAVNTTALKNVGVNFSVNAQAPPPYSMRTGVDNNGDLIFNDRPAGVGRNTLRGRGQRTLNMYVTYSLAVGNRPEGTSGGGVVVTRVGEGGLQNVQMSSPDDARYHVNFTVQALNLTNHANYVGYVGTLTSPFFGQPTTVNNMRKIEFLVNFQF